LAKRYPALDVRRPEGDVVYAVLDDFAPTAIEDRDAIIRVFFADADARDRALAALSSRFDAAPLDVDDEDWARRSQDGLTPVVVGRITISPHPDPAGARAFQASVHIVIRPSMGFGTGHHATTRMCLEAMQAIDVAGKTVIDVGTGSGILAIAAARLGASRAVGLDDDADAIASACENLSLNPLAENVSLEIADAVSASLSAADVVLANLTGAALTRLAPTLLQAVRPGGSLILSGVLLDERDDVVRAFTAGAVAWERHEDEWVALVVKRS
jgi:ribosomal protein L11 methyltransferase